MKIIELPIEALVEAPWNANMMDEAMLEKLRSSIRRYGIVENLVVRPAGQERQDRYEVLSGKTSVLK